MFKKSCVFLLIVSALWLCGAEKVIKSFKSETFDSSAKKSKSFGRGYYVFNKDAQKFAGKNVLFRATITRMEGPAVLGGTFRCSTNPGNKLRTTRAYPVKNAETGKPVEFEAFIEIPQLENIFHFNFYLGFRQNGNVRNVWKVENPRFVVPTAAESAKAAKAAAGKPALSLGGAALLLNKEPLTLVKEGKICFVIVTPDTPDEIVKYAVGELKEHFRLAAGNTPEVVAESKFKGGAAIHVGGTKLAKEYSALPSQLAPEQLIAARAGNAVILAGGDRAGLPAHKIPGRAFVSVGTLYAVYEFLETQLGIRWYWPGKIGTVVPPCRNLSIKQLFISSRPDYDTRKTFYSLGKDPRVSRREFEVWYRRNRFGGSVGDPVANHSFNSWIERFKNTHPEYLALQSDGTRKTNPNPGGGHVCMSNPDVLKQTIEDKIEAYKSNPYSDFSAVMPGDGNALSHCRCDQCQAKVQPEKGPRGMYSDSVWSFVNKAAGAIALRAPGKMVTCCSYADYQRKPSFPLMPNIAVTLCYGSAPRASETYKTGWQALLNEWGSTGARLYVWEYWNNTRCYRGTYGAPAIFPRQLKEIYAMDIPQVHGRAIELSNVDTNGQGFKHWTDWLYDVLNLYAAGHLMWNRSLDIETMLDEYYTSFFGPAAKEMREFHDALEARWLLAGPESGKWDYDQCWKKCYPPEFVDRMMGLLKKAQTAAKGKEPYASRVQWLNEAYQGFDRNSRMFRGNKRKTNPAAVTVPRTGDWKKAIVLKNFCDSYNVYEQSSTTAVKMRHDGTKLYIQVDCTLPFDAAGVKWADKAGARDALLWNNESCEFFFASKDTTIQFILAPENKLADFRHTKGSTKHTLKQSLAWNCAGVQYSAKKKNNTWHGELIIPLAELKLAKPMRFNIYRNARYCMPGEPFKWEQGCYLPVYGGFHNIENFGTLKFQ